MSEDIEENSSVKQTGLAISNLNKFYGSRAAVSDLSFQISHGVTALLGPNGAGKTTVIRCVVGLTDWNKGTIRLEGIDARRNPREVRARIGFLPERAAFTPDSRVASYLSFAARMKGVSRQHCQKEVGAVIEKLDLGSVAKRLIGNLSKGYRQRVGLAQALIGSPPLLILDEPLAGIDPLHIWDFRDVLTDYAKEHTVLLSTHMIPEARVLCDRVLVMTSGKLVFNGSIIEAELSGSVNRRWRMGVSGPSYDELKATVQTIGASIIYAAHSNRSSNLVIEADSPMVVEKLVRDILDKHWTVAHLEPMTDLFGVALEESGLTRSKLSDSSAKK